MIYSAPSDGGFRKGDVYITTGLEFMRDVAIDTHFISRSRISRKAQPIATNPQCIGIGLIVVMDGMHMEYTNIHEYECLQVCRRSTYCILLLRPTPIKFRMDKQYFLEC